MSLALERGAHLGRVGLGVDRQFARDLAGAAAIAQQIKVSGLAVATPLLTSDAEGQRLHRQIVRRDHPLGVERDVHVHRAQLLDMERHVGEEIAGGFELLLGLPLLRRDVAGLARRRADQRRQVGEDQLAATPAWRSGTRASCSRRSGCRR